MFPDQDDLELDDEYCKLFTHNKTNAHETLHCSQTRLYHRSTSLCQRFTKTSAWAAFWACFQRANGLTEGVASAPRGKPHRWSDGDASAYAADPALF